MTDYVDEDETGRTVEDLLDDAPDECDAVARLYSWSTNFDAGTGPMTLFLDLIGWSEEHIGEALYPLGKASLGYMELDKLAAALSAYADRPQDVREYVDALLEAEGRE